MRQRSVWFSWPFLCGQRLRAPADSWEAAAPGWIKCAGGIGPAPRWDDAHVPGCGKAARRPRSWPRRLAVVSQLLKMAAVGAAHHRAVVDPADLLPEPPGAVFPAVQDHGIEAAQTDEMAVEIQKARQEMSTVIAHDHEQPGGQAPGFLPDVRRPPGSRAGAPRTRGCGRAARKASAAPAPSRVPRPDNASRAGITASLSGGRLILRRGEPCVRPACVRPEAVGEYKIRS